LRLELSQHLLFLDEHEVGRGGLEAVQQAQQVQVQAKVQEQVLEQVLEQEVVVEEVLFVVKPRFHHAFSVPTMLEVDPKQVPF
jgi:hypothetical protein